MLIDMNQKSVKKRLDRFQEAEVFTDAQGNYISKSRNNEEVTEAENIQNVSDAIQEEKKQKEKDYLYFFQIPIEFLQGNN